LGWLVFAMEGYDRVVKFCCVSAACVHRYVIFVYENVCNGRLGQEEWSRLLFEFLHMHFLYYL
jgi:hypothetical protein